MFKMKRLVAVVLSAVMLTSAVGADAYAAGYDSRQVISSENSFVSVTKGAKKKTALSTYWSADSASAKKLRSYVKKVTNKKNTEYYIPK